MIRPLTIATCLLACGSGLYLYQEKHEVQLLDRTIERTVHDTNALREQSRLLAAEWTMLNDPERLRQFSDTYLSLKTIAPTQFSSVADLDSRLPAPQAAPPPRDEQELVPVVSEAAPPAAPDAAADADAAPAGVAAAVASGAVADEDLPVPPIPDALPSAVRVQDRVAMARPGVVDGQARVTAMAQPRAGEPHAADARGLGQGVPDAHVADQRPVQERVAARVVDGRPAAAVPRPIVLAAQRPALPAGGPASAPQAGLVPAPTVLTPVRPMLAASSGRPLQESTPRTLSDSTPRTLSDSTPRAMSDATPRPMSDSTPRAAIMATPSAAPYGGSLLGMARGSLPPAPRPTPVSAAYNAN
jgi:hypothetical protein